MRKNVLNKNKNSIESSLKPNGDRVFIRKFDKTTVTKSGLILAIDPNKSKVENMGIIVAVGDDARDDACKPGVKIAYDNILEMDINHEGKEYSIIKKNDIYCFFYDQEEEL